MRNYKYLIVGGGMTGDSAVSGIRELDSKGSLALISAESDPPYDRPPLSKKLWKGEPLGAIWRHTEEHNVNLHLGRTVKAIDAQQKTVTDDQKQVYSFDKLLLAIGGSPRRLPFGGDDIIYFRTLRDYRRLRDWTMKGKRFAVIGGGFIGSEMAAALATNQKEVILLFPGSGICDRMFPSDLSHFLNDFYRQQGVEVWNGESAVGLERSGEQFALKTQSRREITVDGVVAGVGIQPNVE